MFKYLLSPKKILPFTFNQTVHTIDFNALKKAGIKALLIDLDNTLIPYDLNLPNETLIQFFKNLKSSGFLVCIVSNNHAKRIKPFADAVNVPFVASAKKPLKRGLKRGMKVLNVTPSETVMIGDQIMTDVLAAKQLNLDVILVKPIKRKSEKWYTKINRFFERRVLKTIKKVDSELYDTISKE